MSDRLRFLLAGTALCALHGVPAAADAQSVGEWRERLRLADSTWAASAAFFKTLDERTQVATDREIRAGGRVLRYSSLAISSRDSAAFAVGFTRGRDALRARFGDAGAVLIDSSTWVLSRRRPRLLGGVRIEVDNYSGSRRDFRTPVSRDAVERFVIAEAGERLVAMTPALHAFAGSFALRPDWVPSEAIARRLATSWAAAGRRCALGTITACAAVIDRFDPLSATDRYFEPRDYPAVVVGGSVPGTQPDSTYFASRRRCFNGADSACARLLPLIVPTDPFDKETRGSALTLAIDLGGRDAVARIIASPNDEPLALLARAAGVSERALLTTWHARTIAAVSNGPAATVPIALSTLAWGALLLFAGTRRRFL